MKFARFPTATASKAATNNWVPDISHMLNGNTQNHSIVWSYFLTNVEVSVKYDWPGIFVQGEVI